METVALAGLQTLAKNVLARLPGTQHAATVLALAGNLGAGKTTFTQALAKELGIEEVVQSPTYVLMRRYEIKNPAYPQFRSLVHIDAYRLEQPEQFNQLRPETFLRDPNNLICIEWPEKVEGFLPTPDMIIKFSSEGAKEGERFVEVGK